MKWAQAQGILAGNAIVSDGGVPPTTNQLRIFSGPMPATVNAPATGTLLSVANQVGSYAGAVINSGNVVINMVPNAGITYRDTNAPASGTAGYWRITDSTGVAKSQGTVGTTSSFELVLNTTAILAGQIVTITSQAIIITGLI